MLDHPPTEEFPNIPRIDFCHLIAIDQDKLLFLFVVFILVGGVTVKMEEVVEIGSINCKVLIALYPELGTDGTLQQF